jgi:chromosome partitioning protein
MREMDRVSAEKGNLAICLFDLSIFWPIAHLVFWSIDQLLKWVSNLRRASIGGDGMPIIALASVKGGAGKTSATLALAADLASDGARVEVLDADPNGHASRVGAKVASRLETAQLRVTGGVNEANILVEIRRAKGAADWVFIDLPGVSSKLTLLGLTRADLVVIPCQPSEMDIHDAIATLDNVRQASEAADRDILSRLLLSRWPVTIESRAARETRRRLAKVEGAVLLNTPLMERTAIRELTFNGYVPRLADPDGNAAANIHTLALELAEVLR